MQFNAKHVLALFLFLVLQIDAFRHPVRPLLIRRCTGVIKPGGNQINPSFQWQRSPGLYDETPSSNLDSDTVGDVKSDDDVSNSTRSYIKGLLGQPKVEVILAVLVLLSSLVVALETLQDLPVYLSSSLVLIEDFVCGIFAFEYLARWYLSNFSLRHLFKPLVIIDLIAISPLLLQTLCMLGITSLDDSINMAGGVLVNLRLFRILRLQRVLTDYETFKNFEIALGLLPSDAKPYQLQLARVVSSIFTLLSVASGLIYTAEHTVNPQIPGLSYLISYLLSLTQKSNQKPSISLLTLIYHYLNIFIIIYPDYFTAFYFGLTTLTTVGFGDITPVTSYGRIIVSGSILFGVAIIPAQVIDHGSLTNMATSIHYYCYQVLTNPH